MRIKAKDRVGTTIKNFKILDYKRENNRTDFFIHCLLCGNERWMSHQSVVGTNVQGCGCYRKQRLRKDLTGQTFGRLTALEPTEKRKSNKVVWRCECSCGNYKEVATDQLTGGMVRSCGCLSRETKQKTGQHVKEKFAVEGTNITSLNAKISKRNTSGIKGVTWSKKQKKWRAYITFQRKYISLGSFHKKEDAAKARKEAEEKYFQPMLEKYQDKLKK